MPRLGVNIDHVATIRQARGGREPDPVWAAAMAELAGADGITIHLREDRRHIIDRDVYVLKQTVQTRLNLELAIDPAIVAIACDAKPHQVTLVPERREELTTEGGLDVIGQKSRVAEAVSRLNDAGIEVSLFIDPNVAQVEASASLGVKAVELHTGKYADATTDHTRYDELKALIEASDAVRATGMILHAGHGLNYLNLGPVATIEGMTELNIGHAIVSRSIFVGLEKAVREMKDAINMAILKSKG
jgi:pyridoxine 5-phosphate synthase